jgi:protein-S-isoprenylcysteine O-methyltransferase Ste14
MALIEEFTKRGNWLFKHRSYLPLVLYIFATLVILFSDNFFANYQDLTFSLICVGVALFGQLIRILTIGYTPKATSGRNTKQQVADELNTKGIYSIIRHPLYVGNYFMWLGLIIYVGNFWFIIISSLLFWLYYERIMFAEESFLRNKFGDSYLKWAENVSPFLPRFSNFSSTDLTFSFKNVLKREYNGFFAIFVSFAFIDFLQNYLQLDSLTLSAHWLYMLVGSFVIFFTLRSLKKYTKVLEVAGR